MKLLPMTAKLASPTAAGRRPWNPHFLACVVMLGALVLTTTQGCRKRTFGDSATRSVGTDKKSADGSSLERRRLWAVSVAARTPAAGQDSKGLASSKDARTSLCLYEDVFVIPYDEFGQLPSALSNAKDEGSYAKAMLQYRTVHGSLGAGGGVDGQPGVLSRPVPIARPALRDAVRRQHETTVKVNDTIIATERAIFKLMDGVTMGLWSTADMAAGFVPDDPSQESRRDSVRTAHEMSTKDVVEEQGFGSRIVSARTYGILRTAYLSALREASKTLPPNGETCPTAEEAEVTARAASADFENSSRSREERNAAFERLLKTDVSRDELNRQLEEFYKKSPDQVQPGESLQD
jgi:hypothetical protein